MFSYRPTVQAPSPGNWTPTQRPAKRGLSSCPWYIPFNPASSGVTSSLWLPCVLRNLQCGAVPQPFFSPQRWFISCRENMVPTVRKPDSRDHVIQMISSHWWLGGHHVATCDTQRTHRCRIPAGEAWPVSSDEGGEGNGPRLRARQQRAGQGQRLVTGFTAGGAGGRSTTGEGVKAGGQRRAEGGKAYCQLPTGPVCWVGWERGWLPEQSRGAVPGAGVISKALCAVGVPEGVRMGWLRSNTGASKGKCLEHGETAQCRAGHRTFAAQAQTRVWGWRWKGFLAGVQRKTLCWSTLHTAPPRSLWGSENASPPDLNPAHRLLSPQGRPQSWPALSSQRRRDARNEPARLCPGSCNPRKPWDSKALKCVVAADQRGGTSPGTQGRREEGVHLPGPAAVRLGRPALGGSP